MKNWLKLGFCLLLILGFVYFAPKALSRIPAYSELIQNSEEMGIDNTALFYSEEALTSEAEKELNDKLSRSE